MNRAVLDVFYTVDVEIWCDGWDDIDARFPSAFDRYIHGKTAQGDFGLAFQAALLREHGLTGVFFVEPLFATRFGLEPLREVVGIIEQERQELQLHLHTEWVDESREPLVADVSRKRQHLRYFDVDEQTTLIAAGRRLLGAAGGAPVNAFRAGSFAFDVNTLTALERLQIPFDSSYNASMFGPDSGLAPGAVLVQPIRHGAVCEVPMTVYDDGTKNLRHTQLTSCSFAEMEALLWQAAEDGHGQFVILSHGFELLTPSKRRGDPAVIRRLRKLCELLARHDDVFRVRGFHDLSPIDTRQQPAPLRSPLWRTGLRVMEQAYRRRYR